MAITCDDVQLELSRREGRRLLPRGLRSHLGSCRGCTRFRAEIDERADGFALLAPAMPRGPAEALLEAVLKAPRGP